MIILGIDPGLNECAISVFRSAGNSWNFNLDRILFLRKSWPKKKDVKKVTVLVDAKLEENFHFVYGVIDYLCPDVVGIEGYSYQPGGGKKRVGNRLIEASRSASAINTCAGITACKMAIIACRRKYHTIMPVNLRYMLLKGPGGTKEQIWQSVQEIYGEVDLTKFPKVDREHLLDSVAIGHCTIQLEKKEVG